MGEVVPAPRPAHTSPTLQPHPLPLCCNYPVLKCLSASVVVTSTLIGNYCHTYFPHFLLSQQLLTDYTMITY